MSDETKDTIGRKKAFFFCAIFLLFTLSVFFLVGVPIIKNANKPEVFRDWIESKGVWGQLIYVGICFIQVLVAIIPGGPIELAGGYAFGSIEATVLSTIGLGLGSCVVFFLVRIFGQRLLEVFFSKESISELKFLKTSRSRDLIILLLFLVPGTPKDLLCYYCGLTDMPFLIFFFIATFARVPAALISALSGSAAGEKSYIFALIMIGIIVLISILGIIGYKMFIKRNKEKTE